MAKKRPAAMGAAEVRRAAQLLKYASDPARVRVLLTLADGARTVGELRAEAGLSQPAMSHHLGLLRHGGLIAAGPRGRDRFYGLTARGEELATVVRHLVD